VNVTQYLALLNSDPEGLLYDLEVKAGVAGKKLDLQRLHGMDGPEIMGELQTMGVLPTLEADGDKEPQCALSPTFPLDVFPSWFAEFVEAIAEHCQVPEAMSAFGALQAANAIVGPSIRYKVTRGWERHCGQYLCIIADSGTGKSRTTKHFMRPLHALQKEARKDAAPTLAHAAAANEERQIRKSCLLGKLKAATAKDSEDDVATYQSQLAELEEEMAGADEAVPPTLCTIDVTAEHMVRLMAQNGEQLAIVGAETPLFGLMAGRYTQGVIECVESFNDAYDGAPISVGRVSSKTVECEEPRLAVSVATQPIVLFNTGTSSTLAERGTLARFAFFEPVSVVGRRDMSLKELKKEAQDAYDFNLSDIGRHYRGAGAVFEFSVEARTVFVKWRELREAERMAGGRLSKLTGFEGRVDDMLCRNAALLHVLSNGRNAPPYIAEATLRGAMRVTEFLIASTAHVYERMGLGAVEKLTAAIVDYARRNNVTETTVRELTRAPLGVYKTADAVLGACRALANEGVLTLTKHPAGKKGGRPSWYVDFQSTRAL